MITLAPILMAIGYGLVLYLFSSWRTRKALDASSTPLQDPALESLIARMASALDLPRLAVHIHEVEPINGLAAPDGRIFITRGFYNAYRRGLVTAEELASVIAHELGHVALGHTRRRMIDFSGQNAVFVSLVALFMRAIPVVGPLLAAWGARLVTTALAARLSRRDEYEADAWATALMMKIGLGAQPQISLFRKLDALTRSRDLPQPPAWLLSHPKSQERIAAIAANESRWSA